MPDAGGNYIKVHSRARTEGRAGKADYSKDVQR